MPTNRSPKIEELAIIAFLVEKTNLSLPSDWQDLLMVAEMDDGGMGSLKLFPERMEVESRQFGRQGAEIQFDDLDGIPVLATLYLDKDDELYELDVWKVDYNPLLSFKNALAAIQTSSESGLCK